MTILAVWIGKILILGLRLAGKGGSALPGLVIGKVYPSFNVSMAAKLSGGSVLVTGTNGKTTTTKLLKGILRGANLKVISNTTGSNMSRGIASAFMEHATWLGGLKADIGLFEVDEAFMGEVASQLKPKVVVVLNLLRDQLDRYGELDRTAELIAAGLQHAQSVALNADDPLVAALAAAVPSGKVVFFGASAELKAHLPHDDELLAKHKAPKARTAHPKSAYNVYLLASRAKGEIQSLTVGYEGQDYKANLQLRGIYNAYNATAALAAATLIEGVSFAGAMASLEHIKPAFGRSELLEVGGKKLQLLLVKNPAGFNQVIKTFLGDSGQALLVAINDNFADGRDVSWLWDVNFEQLAGKKHKVLASGTRANDLAVRLKYTEVKSVVETDLSKALRQFIKNLPKGATGYIVPTYTAMLELRALIARRSKVAKVYR